MPFIITKVYITPNNPLRKVLLFCPAQKWGGWGTEKISNLPAIACLASGRAQTWIQASRLMLLINMEAQNKISTWVPCVCHVSQGPSCLGSTVWETSIKHVTVTQERGRNLIVSSTVKYMVSLAYTHTHKRTQTCKETKGQNSWVTCPRMHCQGLI